ncbi:hypothetical protein [Longimicrobium terrae]|uniref:Uncharacterized protein n=1 Tax=Longimicrobium terrae TaxID=1639882 RepID=A0A841H1L9_9BACT|nr:hypothetical protein [Longimicrobium terrae]MBB4637484.1 hypothetical protein [Longimicrobium terrae]MBB6071882.1 hypothetical protein [Longimicrobium terrae]NNC30430.1 hypothetical protein [Longimicrobium terrae]
MAEARLSGTPTLRSELPLRRRGSTNRSALGRILGFAVLICLGACAGTRSADLRLRYADGVIPGSFDFTEDEWFAALRLTMPDAAAREHAAEFSRPDVELDRAINLDGLALLSLATESGGVKAERLRQEWRTALYGIWAYDQRQRGAVSEEDLAQRWSVRIAREDQLWEARRERLRQSLQRKGKLPPGR